MSLEATYPPSVVQPRTLMRWLDVQPQGGSLSRTHAYIQLPAFSVAHTWIGYSNLIASYNFTAPNNFSLRAGGSAYPTNPNYTLCISWQASGVVHRYTLWHATGDVIYFDAPMYTGQVIKKNFRLEVWDSVDAPLVVGLYESDGGPGTRVLISLTIGQSYFYVVGNESGISETDFGAYIPAGVFVSTTGNLYIRQGIDFFGEQATAQIYLASLITNQYGDLLFYTSVKGSSDYRYQDDFTLASPSGIITAFSSNLNLPFVFPSDSISLTN